MAIILIFAFKSLGIFRRHSEFDKRTINRFAAIAKRVQRRDRETDGLAKRYFRIAKQAGGRFGAAAGGQEIPGGENAARPFAWLHVTDRFANGFVFAVVVSDFRLDFVVEYHAATDGGRERDRNMRR